MKLWAVTGAILAMLAVILGAYAAHGLDRQFVEIYRDMPPKQIAGQEMPAALKYLNDFKTGVDYQFWHAIGLLLISALFHERSRPLFQLAGWCFLLGIFLFSGSLYLLSTMAEPRWGMVAPFGGLSFILGWLILAIALLRSPAMNSPQTPDKD